MDVRTEPSTEWFRGSYICTFRSSQMSFLGWSIPLADPNYFVAGAILHGFMIFAPFFVLYEQDGMLIQGLLLFLSGPLAAAYLSQNPMEQSSIWSYFSIAQVSCLLYLYSRLIIWLYHLVVRLLCWTSFCLVSFSFERFSLPILTKAIFSSLENLQRPPSVLHQKRRRRSIGIITKTISDVKTSYSANFANPEG